VGHRINEILEKIDEFHKGHYSFERKSHASEKVLVTEPIVSSGNSPPTLAVPRFQSMLNSDANIFQPSNVRISANKSAGSGLIMFPQIAGSNCNMEQNVGGVKLPKINLLRIVSMEKLRSLMPFGKVLNVPFTETVQYQRSTN